jgi:hypothetical protein
MKSFSVCHACHFARSCVYIVGNLAQIGLPVSVDLLASNAAEAP